MNRIASFLGIVLVITFFACESGSGSKSYKVNNPNLREVVVKEIIQTSSYTYLELKEEGDVYWAAIPRRDDLVEGNTYYYEGSMEMKDFPSEELDKTFETIYFLQGVSDKPFPAASTKKAGKKGSPNVGDMEVEDIVSVEGGITVAELYKNKADYAGKKVKLHGKVVKFTSAVMGKNWVHLQDGSMYGDNVDITITTNDVVNVNDIATFEGAVILDKDFGYGYAYDVLVEEAKLIAVEASTSLQ